MYVWIAGIWYALLRASGRTLACAEKAQYGPRQASARERARAHYRQRGHRNVTLSHVRAHARTPGNEAADQLAKCAAAAIAGPKTRCAPWR